MIVSSCANFANYSTSYSSWTSSCSAISRILDGEIDAEVSIEWVVAASRISSSVNIWWTQFSSGVSINVSKLRIGEARSTCSTNLWYSCRNTRLSSTIERFATDWVKEGDKMVMCFQQLAIVNCFISSYALRIRNINIFWSILYGSFPIFINLSAGKFALFCIGLWTKQWFQNIILDWTWEDFQLQIARLFFIISPVTAIRWYCICSTRLINAFSNEVLVIMRTHFIDWFCVGRLSKSIFRLTTRPIVVRWPHLLILNLFCAHSAISYAFDDGLADRYCASSAFCKIAILEGRPVFCDWVVMRWVKYAFTENMPVLHVRLDQF
jgi:hypothetical protein